MHTLELQVSQRKTQQSNPVRRVIIKNYSISAGSMSKSVDHVFHDVIPQRTVIGTVDNDAFNGAFRKNPFNFNNNKTTLCGLLKNNEPFQINLIKPIFATERGGEYIKNLSVPFNRYCRWLL